MRSSRLRCLRTLAAQACFAAVMAGPPAHAQTEAAKKYFEAGKAARDDGDCARAIPAFEQSLAADRSIGAYYNLGFCHEQLGHRQEAYDAYSRALEMASARKDDRLREISGALGALMDSPRIKILLPKIPPGLEIRVDGKLLPQAFYGTETVIFTSPAKDNTKSHLVVARAPGFLERKVYVSEKEPQTIELTPPDTNLPPPPHMVWSWQHYAGLGIAAVGAVAFTIGAVRGVTYLVDESRLFGQYDDLNKQCAAATRKECDPGTPLRKNRDQLFNEYTENEQSVQADRPWLFTALIGGGLMIGGGLVLYLTANKVPVERETPRPTNTMRLVPSVGPRFQGLTLGGTF